MEACCPDGGQKTRAHKEPRRIPQAMDQVRFKSFSSPLSRRSAPGKLTEPKKDSPTEQLQDQSDIRAATPKERKSKGWAGKVLAAVQGVVLLSSLGMSMNAGSQLLADPVGELISDDHDLSAQQQTDLREELSHFDSKEVGFVADRGARLQVTEHEHEVVDLLKESGAVKEVSVQELTSEAVKLRSVSSEIAESSEFCGKTTKIHDLRGDVSQEIRRHVEETGGMPGGMGMGMGGMFGGGMMGGFPGGVQPFGVGIGLGSQDSGSGMAAQAQAAARAQVNPELQRLNQEIFDTRMERRVVVHSALKSQGLSSQVVVPEGFSSVDGLVQRSGAKTPEEKAEYRGLLMTINGERIEQAQSEALEQQREMFEATPDGPFKESSAQWLARSEQNPDSLVFDLEENLVLLPRVEYAHVEGKAYRVEPGSGLDGATHGASGLHVSSSGLLQVDSDAVEGKVGTTSHEMGHSIMHHLSGSSPEFYKGWSTRLDSSLGAAKQANIGGGQVNSHYGLTNSLEYFAEGVKAYKNDPDALKEVDPTLHGLVEEALTEARTHQAESRVPQAVEAAAWLGISAVSALSLRATGKLLKDD